MVFLYILSPVRVVASGTPPIDGRGDSARQYMPSVYQVVEKYVSHVGQSTFIIYRCRHVRRIAPHCGRCSESWSTAYSLWRCWLCY